MSFQTIQRAIELPRIPDDAPPWFRQFLFQYYTRLIMQVGSIQSAFRAQQIAVAGGAGAQAVVLPTPYPVAAPYVPLVVASWLTTHSITAISNTGFTDTFGLAAPGGGGTLYYATVMA